MEIKEIEIKEEEINISNNELREISKQLVELRDLSIMIGRELSNQNKKMDKIEVLLEDNKNIMEESNNKIDEINRNIKNEKSHFSNIAIIGGLLLLPISLKIAVPVAVGGILIKYIRK